MKYLLSPVVVVAILLCNSYCARAQTEVTLLVPGPMGRETMPKVIAGFENKTGDKVKMTFAVGSRDVEPYGTKQLVARGRESDVSIMFAPFPAARQLSRDLSWRSAFVRAPPSPTSPRLQPLSGRFSLPRPSRS